MATVLVVATNDDLETCLTFHWAKQLQRSLVQMGHEVAFLGAHNVTDSNLVNAIASAHPAIEFVIFYGHGDVDRLLAQRSSAVDTAMPILVDDVHVHVLT